jgi:hypothetical protein
VGPRLRRSVRRGWTELPKYSPWLLGILLGSWVFLVLRWTTLKKVPRVGAVRCWFYLAAKPSHVGVIVDRLAYPLHRPNSYGCQPKVQSFWFETVLPYLVAKPFLMESLPPRAHMSRPSGWGSEPLDWCCLVAFTPH